eukprot:1157273-Pelagomonas_calceolata.AAC.5
MPKPPANLFCFASCPNACVLIIWHYGLHPRQGLDRGVPACHLPQAAWFGQPGADQRDLGPGRHAPAPAPCMAVRLCQGKPGDWLVDGEHDQLEAWLSSTA